MLHPRPDLRAVNLALATCLIGQVGALACVLPSAGDSGIELRWTLPEANRADAEMATPRLRTCAGARVTRVRADLRDTADPSRHTTLARSCDAGNPSPADRVREPAELFVDLRPGEYALELTWIDDPGERGEAGPASELGRRSEVVQVDRDDVVAVDLELASPLLPWTLELRGTAACSELTLEIFYAAPDTDLHALPDAAAPAPDGVYRRGLVSEDGLRLAVPVACSGLTDGPQRFRGLDRGAYRLHLDVDGRGCDRSFVVDQAGAALAVDLAKPGCAG